MVILRFPYATPYDGHFYLRHDTIAYMIQTDNGTKIVVNFGQDSTTFYTSLPHDAAVKLWTKTAGTDSARTCWEWVDGDYVRFNDVMVRPPPPPPPFDGVHP